MCSGGAGGLLSREVMCRTDKREDHKQTGDKQGATKAWGCEQGGCGQGFQVGGVEVMQVGLSRGDAEVYEQGLRAGGM